MKSPASDTTGANLDAQTVAGFGAEWTHYDQSHASDEELLEAFDRYFAVFPWDAITPAAVGFDLGCGSGRWARFVAPRVRRLYCVDASLEAVRVARRNLNGLGNCEFAVSSVELPFPDGSMDFGYSLGVLHHVPDTAAALRACAAKLRSGAPLLVYLYYAFDNRPRWYRTVWRASDIIRKTVSRLPFQVRVMFTRLIATGVYFPLARLSRLADMGGMDVSRFPLSFYRNHSFYTMRTDALDRFGTRLEHRFTQTEIRAMMEDAGLVDIAFSTAEPFWCAVGYRSPAMQAGKA